VLYVLIFLFFGSFFVFYPTTYYLRETIIFYPGLITSLAVAVPSISLGLFPGATVSIYSA
jgi:hypothetical protein